MEALKNQAQEQSFNEIGTGIMGGIKNGLDSQTGALTSHIKSVMSGLARSAKLTLGINSPSKVFTEIGVAIPEGLEMGIERDFSRVKGSLGSSLSSWVRKMQATVSTEMGKSSRNVVLSPNTFGTMLGMVGQLNSKIDLNSQANLYLDGEKVATAVNRQNAIRRLQYGM